MPHWGQECIVDASIADPSIADAKLFATMTCNVHCAIFDCALCAGLAIRALVFHRGRCWGRARVVAVLLYVPFKSLTRGGFGMHRISSAASALVSLLRVTLPSEGLLRLRSFALGGPLVPARPGRSCIMFGFGSSSLKSVTGCCWV